MKRSVKILTTLMSLILAFALVACSQTGDVTTPESTTPATPSESTPVSGTPAASNGETNKNEPATPEGSTTNEAPNNEPLPEKTAEELYNSIKGFLSGLGNRHFKVTVGRTVEGMDPMSMTDGKSVMEQSYVVAINGYGTDDFAMYLERANYMAVIPTEGEKQERSAKMVATVIDGMGYVAEIGEDHLRKIKTPVTFETAMGEIVGIPDELYRYEFSDFVDAKCEIEGNNYVLTLTGLTEKKFESELGGIGDESSNQYIYDNTKDFSMTVVFDRNGNIVSTDLLVSYATDYTDADGNAVKSSIKQTGKVEFYSDMAVITVPEDADEYQNNDTQQGQPSETKNFGNEDVTAQDTREPSGSVQDPDPTLSAEDVYAMVERYFAGKCGGIVSYNHHSNSITTYDSGEKDSIIYEELVFIEDLGSDKIKLIGEYTEDKYIEKYVYDGEYLYGYSDDNGEEYKAKMKITPDMVNEDLVGNLVYELPFEFSEFLQTEVRIENGNYVLEVYGITEEAFIEEILNYDVEIPSLVDMAKKFYRYKNEEYRETYVISASGEIVSVDTHATYSFEAKEDIPEMGLEKTSWSYEESHSVTRVDMIEITAPKDADKYTEVNDF